MEIIPDDALRFILILTDNIFLPQVCQRFHQLAPVADIYRWLDRAIEADDISLIELAQQQGLNVIPGKNLAVRLGRVKIVSKFYAGIMNNSDINHRM